MCGTAIAAERIAMAVREHERVLGDVLRRVRIPHDPARDRIDEATVGAVEGLVRSGHNSQYER